jgi:hypothetical protein
MNNEKKKKEENIDLTYLYLYYQQIIDNQLRKIATLKKNISYKIDEIKKIDPKYELSNNDLVGGTISNMPAIMSQINQTLMYFQNILQSNRQKLIVLQQTESVVSNYLKNLETPTIVPPPEPKPVSPPAPPEPKPAPTKEYPINIDLIMDINTKIINTYQYDYYNSTNYYYNTNQNNPLNILMLLFKYSKYNISVDGLKYQTENCFVSKNELLIIEFNDRLMVISHYDDNFVQFIQTSYKKEKMNVNYGKNIPFIFYYGTITINGQKYSYYMCQFYKMNNKIIKDELNNKKNMLKNLLDTIERTVKKSIYVDDLHFENIGFDQNNEPIFIQYNSSTFRSERYGTAYVLSDFDQNNKDEYWYGSLLVILYFIFSNCYCTTFNDLMPLLFQLNQDEQKIYRLKPLYSYSVDKYFKGLYTRSKYDEILSIVNHFLSIVVFEKLKDSIQKVVIKTDITPTYEYQSFELEESDTNYGHNNLLWSSDHYVLSKDSDKQQLVKKLITDRQIKKLDDPKQFFELKRYCINGAIKPNMAAKDNPTLSFSLFIPNNISFSDINNYAFETWIKKYIVNILKLIIVFNYYFPQGNILFYVDHFLIEKLSKTNSIKHQKIINLIDQFFYIDIHENENSMRIDDIFSRFYFELLKYENHQFNSIAEELMFYLYLASIFDRETSSTDFFVYKFKKCFTEQNGHITNGYIGQLIRFISVIQTEYQWKDQTISRPLHIIWRDPHANCLTDIDSQWIKSVSKADKEILYLLPSNIMYRTEWHELISCNGKYDRRSYLAGLIQIKNSTNDKYVIPLYVYLISFGLAFILNQHNLPLVEHRSLNYEKYQGYSYGIDEYLLSNLYKIDYYLRHSLYMSHVFSSAIIPFFSGYNNLFHFCYAILMYYLQKNNIIKEKHLYFYKFIEQIELLRHNKQLWSNRLLHIILSIFPTKYLISTFMFYSIYDSNLNFYIIDVQHTINQFKEKFGYEPELNDEILEKHKLTCKTSARLQVTQWCTDQYFDLAYDQKENDRCFSANYYSGFYFDEPPDLGIGILRYPADMKYAVEALKENNLRNPLNKSDYKLKIEKNDLKNTFPNEIIVNNSNGNIHYFFIFMMLYFLEDNNTELFDEINKTYLSNIYLNNTYSDKRPDDILSTQLILSQLFWKTLNYSGYDVPPEWFNIKFDSDKNYRKFNSIVKKLSKTEKYHIFLIDILQKTDSRELTGNNKWMFPSFIKRYFERLFDGYSYEYPNPSEYDSYKMATYETESAPILSGGKYDNHYKYKYEKYKMLYLELKKSKIISQF